MFDEGQEPWMRRTFSITAGFRSTRTEPPEEKHEEKTVPASPQRQAEMRIIADLSCPELAQDTRLSSREKRWICGCALVVVGLCATLPIVTILLERAGY